MISLKWIIIYGSMVPFFIMIILLYILGVARYITDFEENTCEMTYMFEYPQYVVCRYTDYIRVLLFNFTSFYKYYWKKWSTKGIEIVLS